MTHKHKGLIYTLKKLDSKGKAGKALRMQVLRCVLAVGFALSPWLGGEAFAEGTTTIPASVGIKLESDATKTDLIASGVAHIKAEKVSNNVGLNRFTDFNVGSGQTAYLYFKDINGSKVDTLVNAVQKQIIINGTVNAIKDNAVGGHLYFVSPNGMVVGSSGVINAGALTVMTTGIDDIKNPANAISELDFTYRNLGNGPINIHGKIYTMNGIDLRSLSIDISKASGSTITPYLKTGMVFRTVVNSTGSEGLVDNVELIDQRSNSGDQGIRLQAYVPDGGGNDGKQFGNITLSGCNVDAIGDINIISGESVNINNNTDIKSNNIAFDLEHSNNYGSVGDVYFNSGKIEADGLVDIRVGETITIGENADIISKITKSDTESKVTLMTYTGNITNSGEIRANTSLDIQAGKNGSTSQPISDPASIINSGTIQSTGGGMSFTVDRLLTNNGTIEANGQITFTVGGTLTNQGSIKSTSSNVQAHIGRNFQNLAVYDNSSGSSILTGGIIEAGGNVQVDYELNTKTTGIGVATPEQGESPTIDGIYNSGTIEAKGNKTPDKNPDGTVNTDSGSGNIWLTSSYNITNYGTMEAGRQITLNARDFLDNYGLIEGVTYLDIKSIMGYVYNHKDGVIRAKGGNIDLSSGQANLQIKDDNDGTKKELYRKFTPIIIEGIVEATSDDDESNQTKEGNINITAHLGDIYINGGTIETKPELGTNKEVKAVAGDVILNAAQNITIGFQTESAKADDPTTQAGANGENKDKYERDDEREYYKPKVDTSGNLVGGNASTISGSNVKLSAGSINNDNALIGGNLTLDPQTSVILEGSLKLQGNNMTVSGVQRSGNPSGSLQVVANGVGGTGSAINSLNLNIAGDALFNTLNVNTAEVNVSGDLQIKQLHVVDQAHFTSNNTVIGVYGEATEPRGDQSDALYRDMGNGNDSWMSISMDSKGYEIKNGSEIKSVLGDGTEDPVQMSSKLVDVDPQETLVENYGDATGNFGRFDLVDDSARPSGGIESTDQGSQTVLRQDENGLHIETSDNKVDNGPQIEASDNKADQGSQIDAGDDKVDNGPQIEAGDNKVDNGSQIEAGDDKGDQGSQIEAGDDKGDQDSQIEANDDKDDNGSKIEAGDDKEDEDSQIEGSDKKKDKSKRDKKDKREKKKKDK